MKRVNLFLILLITAITALISTTAIGFAFFSTQQNPYSWMNQMWGNMNSNSGHGMMGQNPTVTQAATNTWLPYFGVAFVVLIALTIVAIIGMSYYLVYPQIQVGIATSVQLSQATVNVASPLSVTNAYDSVAKTLTLEERQIVGVLQAHSGKYLQKYIKAETGYSRLQTHRILARLSERGIVSLEKTGNTNQVTLADWLNQS
jgi:uncharacterized membrane protein